jgi:hypothetical protein
VTAPARIPDGLTDPDAIDAWLEARDTRELQAAADRDDLDAAVMATVPRRRNPDAVTRPDMVAAIHARIAYDQLPFWQRWITPKPAGLVDRHPTGPMS